LTNSGDFVGFFGDNKRADSAQFNTSNPVVFYAQTNHLYIEDTSNNRIRQTFFSVNRNEIPDIQARSPSTWPVVAYDYIELN
jgi:hypothetical protein